MAAGARSLPHPQKSRADGMAGGDKGCYLRGVRLQTMPTHHTSNSAESLSKTHGLHSKHSCEMSAVTPPAQALLIQSLWCPCASCMEASSLERPKASVREGAGGAQFPSLLVLTHPARQTSGKHREPQRLS